jgi:hypothetical protein
MNAIFCHLNLLAERSNIFRDMGSGFREKRESFDPTDLLWWLFVAAIVVAMFAGIASLLARQDKRRLYNSPRALFRALCKAHALDRSSRLLLKQIARAQNLSVPARLFLEPDRFDSAMLTSDMRPQRDAVAALRKRLFFRMTPE